jgi:hypothetical protein
MTTHLSDTRAPRVRGELPSRGDGDRRARRVLVHSAAALGAVVVLGSACGGESPVAPSPGAAGAPSASSAGRADVVSTGGPDISATGMDKPPPFRLSYPRHELRLRPHSWCYTTGCVDGVPTAPPSVGGPDSVRVQVPIAGWALTATFTRAGERCGRRQTVAPTREEGGWYMLPPVGHAGRYDVDLFAQGAGGDMAARFRWVTPIDGPLATPSARLAVIADNDGTPDSYGVELAVDNLADTPRSALAHVTVTAANGRSVQFDAGIADQNCVSEGSVYFDGPDASGKAAAALGRGPFTYRVDLTLDGATYRATARYPRDVIAGNEPSVALTFIPALPAPR